MTKVYTVYHSTYGHTKVQAESVHAGAGSMEGIEAILLTTEEAMARLDELDSADAIIFGCPTYMGSMSAEMKKFLEAAAKKWFVQAWKNKIAGAFTNSSNFSGDKLNTLVGLMINAMQHGMIYVGVDIMPATGDPAGMQTLQGPGPEALNRMSSFTGAMASSFNLKPTEGPGPGDRETARLYGARIATIAKTMKAAKG
ncbi:MAG: NAD(P)H-dependent oxidoreductase [Fimbriiglobus sp.]